MGVKDLWGILSPSCEKKSLWELKGLTIAVDLSSWIVDSQNVGDSTHINMYLRNLFFRTSYLLLLGVKPVFILEGRAPTLKQGTISRRLHVLKENQNPNRNMNGTRGRLNCLQKRCEELLLSLGVRCYKSDGEAEALCSRLNELSVVDAVISQDSDCFLYGARVVLRNFTMSPSYTCDMYTMDNIEAKLGLGRQKLLALSLLCGCDYEAGVQGVGKQSALKFLATLPDDQVLDRLRSWREQISLKLEKSSQMTLEEKLEQNIRNKAIVDPSFPSEEVISEFLSFRSTDLPAFVWMKPSLPSFVVLAERKLAWEEDYIYSKFMPLVTRWHLLHGGVNCGLTLNAIIKKRSVRSMPSYEVQWQHDGAGEVTTVEPTHLVAQVYPELHQAFVKAKEKPKKGAKAKKKEIIETSEMENMEVLLNKLSISKLPTIPPKKRSNRKIVKGLQTLDKFLLGEISTNVPPEKSTKQNSTAISHSTPIRSEPYHSLSESDVVSPLQKNKTSDHKLHTSPEVHSISVQRSFNLSFADSRIDSAVDLSDIVNSIVTRTNCNPAIEIWANKMS